MNPPQEKRFDEQFVVMSAAGTPLLRYTDAAQIKSFITTLLEEERRDFKAICQKVRENCRLYTSDEKLAKVQDDTIAMIEYELEMTSSTPKE